MSHHTNDGDFCGGCEEKLKTAHHSIASVFRFLIQNGYRFMHVAISWRNEIDQNKAFDTGASEKRWPNSLHNKLDDEGNPCSLALDLFRLDERGVAIWPVELYFEIYEFIKANPDLRVRWGGDFDQIWSGENWPDFVAKKKQKFPNHHFMDAPHFEWSGMV